MIPTRNGSISRPQTGGSPRVATAHHDIASQSPPPLRLKKPVRFSSQSPPARSPPPRSPPPLRMNPFMVSNSRFVELEGRVNRHQEAIESFEEWSRQHTMTLTAGGLHPCKPLAAAPPHQPSTSWADITEEEEYEDVHPPSVVSDLRKRQDSIGEGADLVMSCQFISNEIMKQKTSCTDASGERAGVFRINSQHLVKVAKAVITTKSAPDAINSIFKKDADKDPDVIYSVTCSISKEGPDLVKCAQPYLGCVSVDAGWDPSSAPKPGQDRSTLPSITVPESLKGVRFQVATRGVIVVESEEHANVVGGAMKLLFPGKSERIRIRKHKRTANVFIEDGTDHHFNDWKGRFSASSSSSTALLSSRSSVSLSSLGGTSVVEDSDLQAREQEVQELRRELDALSSSHQEMK